ncbi:MAG: T9SS type A sorting domain-containing protein [Bacteroidales bacterium]|nr:T9SS type A sorting domain-containing protein [Bacteroidales bacterium]
MKTPMTKCGCALLLLFAAAATASAQTAIAPSGGYATAGSGSLSFTLGQVATAFARGRFTNMQLRSQSINEGVQQTYQVEAISDSKRADALAEVRVFPNPTVDGVTVEAAPDLPLGFVLYTLSGSRLAEGELPEGGCHIDMLLLPTGAYMLHLTSGQDSKNWKIVKK